MSISLVHRFHTVKAVKMSEGPVQVGQVRLYGAGDAGQDDGETQSRGELLALYHIYLTLTEKRNSAKRESMLPPE